MLKLKALVTTALVALFVGTASADTIIKVGLGGTGPDVSYAGGTFSTVDDGNAGTTGNQDTNIEYTGFLDGLLPDILAGASFSLTGVTASGAANVLGGVVVTQATTGGTFSVYDPANVLLLTGTLGSGVITGSTTGSSGSFFDTSIATFTGGALLAYVATTPASLSLSFTNLLSGNAAAMVVNGGVLSNFTANATGNIGGSAVPEPASVALLLSGVLGGAAARRRKSA